MSGRWDDRDRFYVKLTRATLAHMKKKTPGVGTLHRHLPLSSIDCTVNTETSPKKQQTTTSLTAFDLVTR